MAYPFKAANRALRKSEGIVFSPKSYLFLYYCIYMNKIVVSNNTAVLVNFAEHLSIVSIKRNVIYQCIYMIFGLLNKYQGFLILHFLLISTLGYIVRMLSSLLGICPANTVRVLFVPSKFQTFYNVLAWPYD